MVVIRLNRCCCFVVVEFVGGGERVSDDVGGA
jgi:hypothetical protein